MAVGALSLAVLMLHLASGRDSSENQVDPTPEIYEPSWVYKCQPNEGCQREGRTTNPGKGGETYFDSLTLCWTVCGRSGGIWPKPVTAVLSAALVKIHPINVRYDLSDSPAETHSLLATMSQVATANLVAECGGNVTTPSDLPVVVYISVSSPDLRQIWDTNEEYTLDVRNKKDSVAVHVSAETVYGARHGLETFTQLVAPDRPEYTDGDCGLYLISGAKIRDKPAYKHRGLVLDTSRNFVPLESIKKQIDAMATTKMNVLHWHVTDSHSFPLESSRVPQLTKYGAYSSGEIYSTAEVRALVAYARARGVRVVIEIDAPAHAGNGWQWGNEYGLGNLAVCVNEPVWRKYCIQPPCGQLNPANQQMYRVLGNLYRDIAEMVPQPALFHMGGDEVFLPCWNSSEEILTYMDSKGYTRSPEGLIELWAEFHTKALAMWDEEVKAVGGDGDMPVMLWSSELTQADRISRYLNKDRYVIEVWEPMDSPLLDKLLKLGYRVISVPKDVWYLDHGFWGKTQFSNWRRMYDHRVPKASSLMLGGEVAMWSEYIDVQGLDTRIWPRAASVAERLWANPESPPSAAEQRMQRLRARLAARGLRPDALAPEWCAQHAAKCL